MKISQNNLSLVSIIIPCRNEEKFIKGLRKNSIVIKLFYL